MSTLGEATTRPRWFKIAVVPALAGHALAGYGLYWDVAWHVDVGRDEALLTTPHVMILAGLLVVLLSGVAGLLSAAREGLRVPRALVAAVFSSMVAVAGFPLDELWHQARGIDVTMWSPTHLLMIGGGGLAVVPLWLMLGEARVRPSDGRGARLLHVLVAVAALGGLSSFQGEFDFGVPQFQLLYHPVLILIAGGVALTAARAVLGRGGALTVALGFLAFRGLMMLFIGPGTGRTVPRIALYAGIAVVVEVVAAVRRPERSPLPFALLAGAAIGTVGLLTEWLWASAVARHPWTSALLPEAVLVGLAGAIGAALLGVALASGLTERAARADARAAAAGAVLVAVALLVPLPRTAAMSPQAAVNFELIEGSDLAHVRVVIGPPDAPYNARWWEVMAWQGGGLVLSPLVAGEGSGVYRTAEPVPYTGDWKVGMRLHRGSDLLSVMLRQPADPDAGEEAIEPTGGFVTLRAEELSDADSANPDLAWLAPVVLALVALLAAGWAWLTVRAVRAARTALDPPPVSPPGKDKRERVSPGGRGKLRQR